MLTPAFSGEETCDFISDDRQNDKKRQLAKVISCERQDMGPVVENLLQPKGDQIREKGNFQKQGHRVSPWRDTQIFGFLERALKIGSTPSQARPVSPRLFRMRPNAYAIGANADSALVVVGQPLIDTMSEAEVDAIIGHELGHVANNDMRRMGLARSFQNSLVWYLGFSETLQRYARWILTWLSELMVLRLSRSREYWADAVGAALTSKEHMIAALDKIHKGPEISAFERDHARLMFRGLSSGSMLSTHPTLEERRAALDAETYIRRLPLLTPLAAPALSPTAELPKAEDIAYAKKD